MTVRSFFLFCLLCSLTSFFLPLAGAQETKVKAIVFDFGSVIAKTDRQHIAEFIANSFHISSEDAMQLLLGLKESSAYDVDENLYWQTAAQTQMKTLPDSWTKNLTQVRLQAIHEIPGMIELVKNLKQQGFQTGILSNVRQSQSQIRQKLGLYELFQPILLSYEIGVRKPNVKAYQILLDRLCLPPQAVIFIDNKETNVAAAKSLGMDGIVFENTAQLIQALKERGIQLKSGASR